MSAITVYSNLVAHSRNLGSLDGGRTARGIELRMTALPGQTLRLDTEENLHEVPLHIGVTSGTPISHTGAPMADQCGALKYAAPFWSRESGQIPSFLDGWVTIPEPDFDDLWRHLAKPGNHDVSIALSLGPVSYSFEEGWVWNTKANEWLDIGTFRIRLMSPNWRASAT